ncbi:MAG: hypothetical protein DWQ18_00180 [Crenarchaeota archaeon]|nr:MAG: hypothetical protein DWQ17_05035 [Thermoproteota archaeon]RDJ34408.1 MAG: hypothetical protein DWQ18_00180 [Thermoproteota archaeon]RDJ34745.1 MAG: hypothetical protein DWQ19_13295 [Thermoproteota archaeon]RDJ38654.1 MAG: hypothetical protein DWQ13_04640 [Thermoproteota archaeon]
MNKLTPYALLVLVASITFAGVSPNAEAQDDPRALLKLVIQAENQIKRQISSMDTVSDDIQKLLRQGSIEADALEESIKKQDVDSARKHFQEAMRIFKQISHMLSDRPSVAQTDSTVDSIKARELKGNLERIIQYVNSLKNIANREKVDINFSEINSLIDSAKSQIIDGNYDQAYDTLEKLKSLSSDANQSMRDYASQKASDRARDYANDYLEKLDRLIEQAKNLGQPDQVIKELEDAREDLSNASSTTEIVEKIRKIISIKKQFELTKSDRIESRVSQIEKILDRLSGIDGIDTDSINSAKKMVDEIKAMLTDGEFESAQELLRVLTDNVKELQKSS